MLVVIEGVLAIIDGWIVDLKEHRLVKPSRACRKRSKEHIAKLNSVPLVNWETLYDEKCALKNITNDELFKHIKCERYEFAEMVDASTRFINKSFKTVNKGKYVRTYFCNCHCICIGNRRNIFLRNIPPNANMIPVSNIAAGKCNRTIRRDNSVLQRELMAHEFKFTKQDIDVLQRYTEVAGHFRMVGENYLTFVYNKASGITSEFLKKNFHDGYTCLVNNFDPDTIIKYGRRLGPSIHTFIHAKKLSPFSGLEFLPHDDLLLLRDSSDPEKLLAVLGPLFRDLVMKNTHREYISRWLRMAALKYESWEDTSIPCPKKPIHTFRQLMDSVRCFIVFSLLCVVDNIPAAAKVLTADEQSRDMFFPWFKSIYIKAANEENTEAHTFITANFVTQSVEIHGLYLSFGYIKDLRKDVHRDIELCVDMLSEWLSFGTISQVYYNGMGNRSVRIRDDLYRDSDIVNVFHVIDRSLLSSFFMGWRSPGYLNDENIRETILKIVNRITKILMAAVWICPGLQLR